MNFCPGEYDRYSDDALTRIALHEIIHAMVIEKCCVHTMVLVIVITWAQGMHSSRVHAYSNVNYLTQYCTRDN